MTDQRTDDVEAPLLEVTDLTLEYKTGGRWTRVVEGVSFTLGPGKTMALVGESGSGKTVSATAILGLVGRRNGRVARGSIRFRGRELVGLPERDMRRVRGREIAMIFQNPMRSLNPAYTVGEQIAEIARVHLGLSRSAARSRAIEMLEIVGIADPASRVNDYPHMFSGGMAQRLSIAVAICGDPSLIIADEPTTALDVTVQARMISLLREIQERTGVAIVFISHDLSVVAEIADSIVVMYAGEAVESGSCEDVFISPQHPYTAGLLSSIPILGSGRALTSIPGMIPASGHWAEECRFSPRCSHAMPGLCDVSEPEMVQHGTGESRCFRVGDLNLEGVMGL